MFTIETVKNLIWDDAEHTSFSCVVKYEEFNEEVTSTNSTTYFRILNIFSCN